MYDSPFSAEGFLWNKLFEKDVLEGLIFDTNLSMNEDQLFAFEAIKRVDGLVVTNEPLYFYRTSNVSATANMTAEKYKQALYVANKLLDIVGNEVEEVVVGYKNYFASICYNYCGYLAKKWPSGWSHEIKIYRQKYIQNYAPSLLRDKDKKWKQMFVKSFSLWVFAMISYSLARNIFKLIKR